MRRVLITFASLVLMFTGALQAQAPAPAVKEPSPQRPQAARERVVSERFVVRERTVDPSQVRVQLSINFFVAGAAGDSEQAEAAREQARRKLYKLATGECAIVEEIMARACRLENVNINLHRQQGLADGINVSGSFTLMTTLK